MLRISKLTDYATVILSYMARDQNQQHAATEIADDTGIAAPTVSKILKILTRAEVLNSTRGAKGGYRLAHTPDHISVAAIISALEGPISVTECSLSVSDCDQSEGCGIHANWGLINRAIQSTLDSITLADMILPNSPNQSEIKIPLHTLYTQP